MNTRVSGFSGAGSLRLPLSLLKDASIPEDDEVEVSVADGSITIRRLSPARFRHRTIQERFAGYEGRLEEPEIDWGAPVGGEVW